MQLWKLNKNCINSIKKLAIYFIDITECLLPVWLVPNLLCQAKLKLQWCSQEANVSVYKKPVN